MQSLSPHDLPGRYKVAADGETIDVTIGANGGTLIADRNFCNVENNGTSWKGTHGSAEGFSFSVGSAGSILRAGWREKTGIVLEISRSKH